MTFNYITISLFRVSKIIFEDLKDKITGRVRDLENHSEELEDRIKIVERHVKAEAKKATNKLETDINNAKRKSILVPQVPNMEVIYKRLSDLEGYIDSIRTKVKSMDNKFNRDIVRLSDNKLDKNIGLDIKNNVTQ